MNSAPRPPSVAALENALVGAVVGGILSAYARVIVSDPPGVFSGAAVFGLIGSTWVISGTLLSLMLGIANCLGHFD